MKNQMTISHDRITPRLVVVRRLGLGLVILLLALTTACRRRSADDNSAWALPPGQLALRQVPPHEWPDFTLAFSDRRGLLTGIEHSLRYLSAPSSRRHFPIGDISHERTRRGLEQFAALLREEPDNRALITALRRDFVLYASIGHDQRGEVVFTGYYTPIFEASLTPDERFRYPIHRRPDDLIDADDDRSIAWQQLPDGRRQPYPSRAVLEDSGALRGLELAYLPEPYDPYNVQVQGSAKLRLRDGRIMEVGYAGTNGHSYVSIGQELVNDGHIRADRLSLPAIRDFFARHPERLAAYTRRNPRVIFFREAPGGPFGSLGQPVIAEVSIATDKSIFPRGALTYVVTHEGQGPRARPYAAFRLDHDTGGAIRAPGRCDLYMGEGPQAERRAGLQRSTGRLYYLVARE